MTTESPDTPQYRRVIAGTLFRGRRRSVSFNTEAEVPKPEPVRRPAKVATLLALAHKIQDAIDRGAVDDRAMVARRLGFTRARVTQLLDLTLLAPDIQERLLELEAVDGVEPMSERALRVLLRHGSWGDQRNACSGLPMSADARRTSERSL